MKFSIFLTVACICTLGDISGVATTFVKDVTNSVLGLTGVIIKAGLNMIEDRSEIDLPISMEQKERKILHRISELDRKISDIRQHINHAKLEMIEEIVSALTRTIKVELRFNDLLQYIDDIDYAYSHMQEYAQRRDSIDRSTLEDFARTVVSHSAYSVRMRMERVHRFIVPKRKLIAHSSILELMANTEKMQKSNNEAVDKQSPTKKVLLL